jgi:hypothetical protein
MVSTAWSHDHSSVSWADVSREKPCPICGKPDWCRVAKGGRLVTCHRTSVAPGFWRFLKSTASGGGVFALDDPLESRRLIPQTVSTKPVIAAPKAKDDLPERWGDLAKAHQGQAGSKPQELADRLGVSVQSLIALGCGWDPAKPFGMKGNCWTFPSRDGEGNVIGIALRFPEPRRNRAGKESNKGMMTGGRQGLFYDPASWSRGSGPILLVEGASDTAAAMTMGLAVVGRPSNRGGVMHLANLLEGVPADRPILVVGERDEKGDGNWPGRDGAIATATQLAKELHRTILWSIVPDGAKDTREFLQAVSDISTSDRIGQGFQKALLADATGVAGPPLPIRESMQTPQGPARDLGEWRQEVAAARLASVNTPGLHLDRSQTGAGKTYATVEAIRQASRSLTVLPTHQNVRERVAEMQAAGIPAVAFPELTPDTCQNYGEASRAQAAGLPVGRSACIGCKFKTGCEYRRQAAAAQKADHRVGTHERLIRAPSVATECSVVVIDEKPAGVIRPSLTASPAGIQAVANMAHRIAMRAARNGDKSGALTFARTIIDTCDAITGAMTATEPGRYPVSLPPVIDVPERWQAVLWRAMQLVDTDSDPDSVALQLVTKAATGELETLDIVVERVEGGLLNHLAFGTWRTPLAPDFVSYQLLDATASADDVAAVAGRPVADCTPAGHLAAQHPVIQIPLSITSQTSPAKVAGIVRAILDRYPQYQRVGLIGHSAHIRAMMGEGATLLDADARGRIAKHCYFWEGPDRASNDWNQVCDVVLVIGVPRPNPMAVRSQLLLLGQDEAATIPDPVWGERHWDATTTAGDLVTIPGRGYHHPEWHRAHASLCRSQLLQCMGRARSIIPDRGVPCLVVADEPTGAVVDTSPMTVLPAAVQRMVDAIRRLSGCQLSAIGTPYREKLSSPTVRTAALLADPAFAGLTRQAVTKQLDAARKLGVIHSPGRGLWAIPTDQPAAMPMTVQGPAEPVSQAVAMADPIPEATMQATTSSVPADVMDSGRLELIEERAAMLEFDAGLDRDEADRLALAMVMGPEPAAAGGPVHQDVAGGDCIVQRPRKPAENQGRKGPSKAQRPVMPPGSPAESDRRSFASVQGDLWSPAHLRQLNPWGG